MNSTRLIGLAALGLGLWLTIQPADPAAPKAPDTPAPAPAPVCPGPNCPTPAPTPPKKPRRPWAAWGSPVGDNVPAVDLISMPRSLRPNNCGGRDGSGLCVFTAIQYAGTWQNDQTGVKQLQSKMRQEPGGGYPEKVTAMLKKYCPGAQYIQYQGSDPTLIEQTLKTGRPVSITWQGNHMLSCVFLDASRGCIVDNNSPDRYQWLPRSTFLQKWKAGGGGWCVVLLDPGPPPPPSNRAPIGPPVRQAQGLEAAEKVTPRINAPIHGGLGDPGSWLLARGESERWTLNGSICSRVVALAAVGADVPDDSARPHLTVIGSAADRQRVLSDLQSSPALAAWRDKFRVQSYAPDAWEVQGMGYVSTGKPTIYLQSPTGQVLLRRDNYTTAEDLAGALRRADPSYDPSKDPNGQPVSPFPVNIPIAPLVLAGLGGVLALSKGGSDA